MCTAQPSTEPNPGCTEIDHWHRWLEISVLDASSDFPDVGADDIFHDMAQNMMYQIDDLPTLLEFSRRTGVVVPRERLHH